VAVNIYTTFPNLLRLLSRISSEGAFFYLDRNVMKSTYYKKS